VYAVVGEGRRGVADERGYENNGDNEIGDPVVDFQLRTWSFKKTEWFGD
jgi:hypothetical protein